MIYTVDELRENWPIIVAFISMCIFMGKLYNDYLHTKAKQKTYQDTTDTVIGALKKQKDDNQREVREKFEEQAKSTALEIKLARSEAQRELLEYKQENSKRLDEQGKLIQQLLLNTKEIGVNVSNMSLLLAEIKANQKDNQNFREQFYKEQAANARNQH